MNVFDDETLGIYVEDCREHLASVETDLLSIEEDVENADDERVNRVFRSAHSIKGGAGFFGLYKIKDLAHRAENVLDMIRSHRLDPNPEVINTLLKAIDKLREMFDDVGQSNEEDIDPFVRSLLALSCTSEEQKAAAQKQVDISPPRSKTVLQISELDLVEAREDGNFIYWVEYDLIHDVQRKGKTPLDVLMNMLPAGKILDCVVDFSSVGCLGDEPCSRLPFFVLFATVVDPTIIGALFDIDPERIHLISEDIQTKPFEMASESPSKPEGLPSGAEPEPTAKESCPGPRYPETPLPPVSVSGETEEQGSGAPDHECSRKGDVSRTNAVKSEAKQKPVKAEAADTGQSDTSLRVHVSLLDTLMTLAGEMVLSRNQLLQAMSSTDRRSLEIAGQRINLITSELQEAIMITRMQPIANLFNKFPRVVRDMARSLEKEIQLTLEGKEVELDKTIIEGLSDPLTHLVRNAVDHGIEGPETRTRAGKDAVGHVLLKAYHEAGQVNIEIGDDGKGLDGNKLVSAAISKGLITEEQAKTMSEKEKTELIFLPGFSTAEKVSDISGRGVGMDVVKTNLDRLGGQVQIDSEPGRGTTIRIKLPLTMAIIPSLIFSIGGDRFAVPQVNLDELIRIPAAQVKERMEIVGDAEVVRVRESLLPILRLDEILGIERTYIDPNDGIRKKDRRTITADRRSTKNTLSPQDLFGAKPICIEGNTRSTVRKDLHESDDRRYHASSAVNILVVSVGSLRYGLVVDELHDSEEIVVKPLGRHLKQCHGYAGATILGDGRVALILDVAGITRMVGLSTLEGMDRVAEMAREAAKKSKLKEVQSLLVFRNAPDEQFAVPLGLVARIEQIKPSQIELIGGRKSVQYRGGTLPVFEISEVAKVKPIGDQENLLIIVFVISGMEVGLLAALPVDGASVAAEFDCITFKQPGIMGSAIVNGYTTLMVDAFELMKVLNPQWFGDQGAVILAPRKAGKILLAEDSDFFRNQVKNFIQEEGYAVLAAPDGLKAWKLLEKHAEEITLVVTDIEMPNMDGYELTRRIRSDTRFARLPVIAVTALASEEDMARGKAAGISDYQVKLDREKLMESILRFLDTDGQ